MTDPTTDPTTAQTQTLDAMTEYVMRKLLENPTDLLTRDGGDDGTWLFDDGTPVVDDVMTRLFRAGILTPLPLATEYGGEAEAAIITRTYNGYAAAELVMRSAYGLIEKVLSPSESATEVRAQLVELSDLIAKLYEAGELLPNYRYPGRYPGTAESSERSATDAGMDWESGADISWDVGREGE